MCFQVAFQWSIHVYSIPRKFLQCWSMFSFFWHWLSQIPQQISLVFSILMLWFLQFATSSFKNKEIRWEYHTRKHDKWKNKKQNENNSLEFLKMLRIESCPFFNTCHVLSHCFFFSFPVFSFIFMYCSCLITFVFPFFSHVCIFLPVTTWETRREQKFQCIVYVQNNREVVTVGFHGQKSFLCAQFVADWWNIARSCFNLGICFKENGRCQLLWNQHISFASHLSRYQHIFAVLLYRICWLRM